MSKNLYPFIFCASLTIICTVAFCTYMSWVGISDSEALLLEMSEALTKTADIDNGADYSSNCNDTNNMTFTGGTKCRSIKQYKCSVPNKTGKYIDVPVYDADGNFVSYIKEEVIEYKTEMLDVCKRVSKENADKDACQKPISCSTLGGSIVEGQ